LSYDNITPKQNLLTNAKYILFCLFAIVFMKKSSKIIDSMLFSHKRQQHNNFDKKFSLLERREVLINEQK